MNQTKTDLIVIGGGILGTFHAYHALEMGLTVRLFEKNKQPRGATVRNFGQVVPSGMNAEWQQLGRKSLAIYKQLQAQFDLTMRPNGSYYIASDEEEMTLLEELRHINRQNDYASELLTQKQCLQRLEGLKEDYCRGALFFPEEVTVESREMILRVLGFLSKEKGLLYQASTPILQVQQANGHCEVLDNWGRVYTAEQVIICSGDEFRLLFPDVFANSDLELTKLQMMQTVRQPSMRVNGNILTGLSIRRYESFQECPSYQDIKKREDKDAYWKKWGIHILFKQSPDGSFIIGDSHEYADAAHADDLGFDIHPEINDYMLTAAKEIFQLEDWTLEREWFGVYSQCKTQDLFSQTIDENIHIVTGIGGKGMTASAGLAEKHLAQLMGTKKAFD